MHALSVLLVHYCLNRYTSSHFYDSTFSGFCSKVVSLTLAFSHSPIHHSCILLFYCTYSCHIHSTYFVGLCFILPTSQLLLPVIVGWFFYLISFSLILYWCNYCCATFCEQNLLVPNHCSMLAVILSFHNVRNYIA